MAALFHDIGRLTDARPEDGSSVRLCTGLEIMRVLKHAVQTGSTHFLENHAAVELLDDGAGQVTGAVLWHTSRREIFWQVVDDQSGII